MAPALWHRTWTYFSRELAVVTGMTHAKLLGLVKPRMVKVAEYSVRGGPLPRHHPLRRRSTRGRSAGGCSSPGAVRACVVERTVPAGSDLAGASLPELPALGGSPTPSRAG